MDTQKDSIGNLFQDHHFNPKLDSGTPSDKADNLRNIMVQIECARKINLLPTESSIHIQRQYLDLYSNIVDNFDDNIGLNNYAEGALALCANNKNESQKWKTSLTAESVMGMSCMNNILKNHQNKKNALDKEYSCVRKPASSDHQMPVNMNVNDKATNKSSNACFQNQQQPPDNRNTDSYQQVKAKSSFYNTKPQDVKLEDEVQNTAQRRPLNGAGNNKPNLAGCGTNTYHPVTSVSVFRQAKNNSKRSHQETEQFDDKEEENTTPSASGSFKTAKQQLAIESQKNRGNRGGGQAGSASYGTGKKSLGTRRGTNSKFVPPTLNRDQDEGSPQQHRGVPRNPGESEDEPCDERLKGIEPKMIELIMNEIMDHGPKLTWDDIAGLEFAKKTIKEIVVWPMLRPDIFTGLRGPPKGLLLFGPPGTGKTLIGKCIASQSKSTFFSISASSLTSKWVGEGEKMVRALFAVARVNQPAVVFIDEIDSLLSQRSDGEHEASRRIKTEFLVQLDGATTDSDERLLVIGATNRPKEIDEAARRRFVKRLYIPLPDHSARVQIVSNLLQEQSYTLTEEQQNDICSRTEGYSGADMANVCREAALGPIRSISFHDIQNISAEQVRPITNEDFLDALVNVKASVSERDLDTYIEWNKMFGSGSR